MTALERLVGRRNQALPRLMHRLRSAGLIQQPIGDGVGQRVRIHGNWVLNFASANYLGLNRDPRVLGALSQALPRLGISLGMPRLLATDPLTASLETEVADLVCQDKALVFPSTTHLALDVLPLLAGSNGTLFIDEWAYPISMQAAYVAGRRGARIHSFPHNDHQALARALEVRGRFPDKVIVCDGVYPAGGELATLSEIVRVARSFDAVVYVDDAHGIGVLGKSPTRERPYGRGGGGTPRHLNVAPGNLVHVGSLSKAFGVPIAFVAGPTRFIDHLRATADAYTHSSPPAIPVLAAALRALRVHAAYGQTRRRRLANRVRRFRGALANVGVRLPANRLFPIQTLRFTTGQDAEAAGRELRRTGIWPVLQFRPPDHPTGGVLRFVLSAGHEEADIDEATAAIWDTLRFALGHSVLAAQG